MPQVVPNAFCKKSGPELAGVRFAEYQGLCFCEDEFALHRLVPGLCMKAIHSQDLNANLQFVILLKQLAQPMQWPSSR